MVFTASPLDPLRKSDKVKKNPTSLFVVCLKKAITAIPLSIYGRQQWSKEVYLSRCPVMTKDLPIEHEA